MTLLLALLSALWKPSIDREWTEFQRENYGMEFLTPEQRATILRHRAVSRMS